MFSHVRKRTKTPIDENISLVTTIAFEISLRYLYNKVRFASVEAESKNNR